MTEAQFNQLVDELMFSIEEAIDDSGVDLDYENKQLLTVPVNAGSQIFCRQPPLKRYSCSAFRWISPIYKLREGEVWLNSTVAR